MTTKERATVQAFINKLSELDSIESETLKTLQDMCEANGDGYRWCSWDFCLEKIAKANGIESLEYKHAAAVYKRYVEVNAQKDLIREFGGNLANIGFWKH